MASTDRDDSRRTMTSAIPGLSVAEVRKCLGKLRINWTYHSQETPMDISSTVWESENAHRPPISMSDFAYRFVIGHHRKRHLKGKPAPGT